MPVSIDLRSYQAITLTSMSNNDQTIADPASGSGWVSLDTGTGHLLAAEDRGVLSLTLSRPEVRNAMSLPMLDALAAMIDHAAKADDVRVVVVGGTAGTFCAGGDLTMIAQGASIYGAADDPAGRMKRQQAAQRATIVRLHDLAKPTIALIEGAAVGAGLGLALACDLRYAGTSATLRTGFGALGLAGDYGCTWFLRQLTGPARALELLYFSEPLTAARACEFGLVNGVFADAGLRDRGMELARRLADAPRQAVRAMKEHVARAGRGTLAECADAEAEWHVQLVGSEDHRAAARALARRLSTRAVPGIRQSGDDQS
jgi:2-(1,2-epoxy-1,2-dihydrophenyl)acetyl-CoA isomerase